MKKFDENYSYLKEMYVDDYYPVHLVDKVRDEIKKVVTFLEAGVTEIDRIQEKFDEMTIAINELQEEFWDNDSEIETVARDSIATDVIEILSFFEIDLDVEDALMERDW